MERIKKHAGHLFDQGFSGFGPSRFRPADETPIVQSQSNPKVETLRDWVREQAPRHPGCYGMLDRLGRVIYIGKAKNLRLRLLSYFRVKSRDPKAGKILDHTKTLLWEQTADEFSALLRELELIRRFRPRFNVQGQPGPRRYLYVCLGRKPAPYVYLTGQPTGRELACYGPLMGRRFAAEAVRRLNDWHQLRDCSSKIPMIFAEQPELFPVQRAAQCLRYDLGSCRGPCAAFCSQREYQGGVRSAKAFLDGRDTSLLDTLIERMTEASQQCQFEKAMALRDRLLALQWLTDRLQFLRNARLGGAYIYALPGSDQRVLWYLIHRGEVQAVVRPPKTEAQAIKFYAQIDATFAASTEEAIRSDRTCDSVLLVAAWFRRYPDERERLSTLSHWREQCLAGRPQG